METSRAKYLIVDTSAFINNVQLHTIGEIIITIPEVIAEVRNKRQYRHLFSLTHDVEIKDVFPESIIHVTEFARRTGDYATLSATDIKLIALTYQLEIEKVGKDHLRSTPIITNYDVNKKTRKMKLYGQNGLCLPITLDKIVHSNKIKGKDYENLEENDQSSDEPTDSAEEDEYETANESVSGEENSEEELNCNFDAYDEENEDENVDNKGEDDDDEFGWITPNNIKQLKKSSKKFSVEEKSIVVGCLSTDFAIQNVLLQLGLNVVTVDGKIIKQLRTYILRCYACFNVTPNIKKMFCPKCGNKTLKRVSVFLDKTGNKQMFINFKKPLTARGKRFPLPYPQTGKHAVNPRLVEDARRPHQKPTKLARTKTDALDDDYITGSAPFVMRDIHSRSAQHGFNRGKYDYKYWMQKNPNKSRSRSKK